MVYTYGQLAHLAQRVAAQLHARGLHPGDRVVIYANNSPQYIGALWGIWWAGMVAVPVNAKLHVNELMYILDHCEARVVLSDDGHAGLLRAGLAPAGPRAGSCEIIDMERLDDAPATESSEPASVEELDPVWLFYTSGTTGRPKGVTLAKRQLDWLMVSYVICVGAVRPSSSMLHAAASRSVAARGCFENIIYGGAPMYISDVKAEPDAGEALAGHVVQRLTVFTLM